MSAEGSHYPECSESFISSFPGIEIIRKSYWQIGIRCGLHCVLPGSEGAWVLTGTLCSRWQDKTHAPGKLIVMVSGCPRHSVINHQCVTGTVLQELRSGREGGPWQAPDKDGQNREGTALITFHTKLVSVGTADALGRVIPCDAGTVWALWGVLQHPWLYPPDTSGPAPCPQLGQPKMSPDICIWSLGESRVYTHSNGFTFQWPVW